MIAVWMAYALITGALIMALGSLIEQVVRARRWPTRGVWVGAMSAMLLIGVAAAHPEIVGSRAAAVTATPSIAPSAAADGVRSGPRESSEHQPLARLIKRVSQLRSSLDRLLATMAARATPWNQRLLFAWTLLSISLAGVVTHATIGARRQIRALETRDVDGTRVLLTDADGPAAVGTRAPAILLPRWTLDLDDALRKLVLRHEGEHIRARDPALLLSAYFGIVLLPWHLPLWWAWHRLRLAVEVDCDARVLRTCPDVRLYGQLLLLTGQRAGHTPWMTKPIFTVAAPLRPRASHLARRIQVMTQERGTHSLGWTAFLVCGAVVTASAAFAFPVPRHTPTSASVAAIPEVPKDDRAIVHLTEVGLIDVPNGFEILVFSKGVARVGIGVDAPMLLVDTLHLKTLPAITADVTDADVHIVLVGPGRISVGGNVTGGPATHVTANGKHITLLKGGIGIRGD
jgi:bla regulator protein BlaR1